MPCKDEEKCETRFKAIESRLADGDSKFAVLTERIDNLIKSQNMLTKASWGLAASIIVTLVGFVLGKI